MSYMLTNFFKKSKSASPFHDQAPSKFKSDSNEQSSEAQPNIKMNNRTEVDLTHEAITDAHLITPDPLTFPNLPPTFSDAHETIHEQAEDIKSNSFLQDLDNSQLTELAESDMSTSSEMRGGQQAKMGNSVTTGNASPSLQLTISKAEPRAEIAQLKDNYATLHLAPSPSGLTDHSHMTGCDVSHASINIAALDLQTTGVPSMDKVPDATGQTLIKSTSIAGHNINSGSGGTVKCQKPRRGLSAPPEVCKARQTITGSVQLENKNSSNATGAISGSMPAHVQMLNQLQGWALHLGEIKDADLCEKLITAISQKMEKTWINAMRMGQIPVHWQEDEQAQAEIRRGRIDMNAVCLKDQDVTDHDVLQHEWYPRGRLADKDKTRKKRLLSPAREVVIDTKGHKHPRNYSITAGELLESGISMHKIQARVAAQALDDDDELLEDILEDLEQTELVEYNWKGVVPRTAYNIFGRDLKLYCLWEAQRSISELEMLNGLLGTFRNTSQIRNTENRIKAEQELHDQLLALALELATKENGGIDSRESRAQLQPDVGQVTEPTYVLDSDDDEVELLPQQTIEKEIIAPRDLTAVDEVSFQDIGMKTPVPTQETLIQNGPQAITSTASDAGTGQLNDDGRKPESVVKREPGLQRTAEDHHPTSELLAKEQRREIQDDEVDLPDTRAESASPSSSAYSIPPESSIRQRAYIQLMLCPKANQYLLRAGQPPVAENTSWPEIRDALRAAGVHAGVRNDLVKDYKRCIDNWDIPVKEEDGVLEVEDIVGYPTRKEIFNSLKPEGVTGKELQATFGNRVGFSDTKWQTLVHSVAYHDRAAGRWYRKDDLAEKLRHRRIVILKFPGKKGFNPEDYSSRTVNNTQGFRWRYVSSSTVAQRHAMDESIDAFVKHTKEGYRTTNPEASQHPTNVRYKYPGRYEMLINPTDYVRINHADRQPDFEPPPAVIHGIWDFRGRKNEDKRVPGFEWFYEGKDGEVVDKWVVRHERPEDGALQGPTPPYEKIQDGTWKRVVEKEIEGMRTEDQASGKHVRVNLGKRATEMQPNLAKRLKLSVNSMVPGTGLDGAIGPARGMGGQRAVVIKRAKRAGASRGTKDKGPATPQPMALTRARRSRTKGVKYADDGDDDSDGEFMP